MSARPSWLELTPLGLIKVSGADAAQFLQGQLTCDVREVSATRTRLGAHCSYQGRVQAIFRLLKIADDFYLQLARSLIASLLSALHKYAVFSKVTLTDVSADWQQWGLLDVADPVAVAPVIHIENIDEVQLAEPLLTVRVPSALGARYCLLSPHSHADHILQALQVTCAPGIYAAWELADINAGLPTLTPVTIDLFTPQQLNLLQLNGVSLKKGCYTGQEIIARTHYLGKAKQQLAKVIGARAQMPLPGARLQVQKSAAPARYEACGTLLQATPLDAQQFSGLAVIDHAALAQPLYLTEHAQPITHVQPFS